MKSKIDIKISDSTEVKFEDIETGDIFCYGNTLYQKTDQGMSSGGIFNSVHIKSGMFAYFLEETLVEFYDINIEAKRRV